MVTVASSSPGRRGSSRGSGAGQVFTHSETRSSHIKFDSYNFYLPHTYRGQLSEPFTLFTSWNFPHSGSVS